MAWSSGRPGSLGSTWKTAVGDTEGQHAHTTVHSNVAVQGGLMHRSSAAACRMQGTGQRGAASWHPEGWGKPSRACLCRVAQRISHQAVHTGGRGQGSQGQQLPHGSLHLLGLLVQGQHPIVPCTLPSSYVWTLWLQPC